MTRTLWTSIALAGAVALTTSNARADDEDAAACNGAVEGDSCTEVDGEAGICRADPDDGGRLECEDLECDGLTAGDTCTDSDGEPGVCRADDDDQGRLECEDTGGSTPSGSSAMDDGCAIGAGPGSAAVLLLALGAAAVRARRRSTGAPSRT